MSGKGFVSVEDIAMAPDAAITPGHVYSIAEPKHIGRVWHVNRRPRRHLERSSSA